MFDNSEESAIPEEPIPRKAVSIHARWGRILAACVSEDGWVDYRKVRTRFAPELKRYLGALGRMRPAELSDRADAMAFWINAYNALCVQTLLDHDLPAKVPHAVLFGRNIFTERTYEIAGKVRSLDDIEHGVLRAQFDEPRVHASLVCGASSCPRLRPEAYDGKRLEEQLEEEVRRWINSGRDKKGQRKNHLDRPNRIFYASKIFHWFKGDFGGSDAAVLAFIRKHADETTEAFLKENRVRLEYLPYDWSLNSR